jgi:hypothetical protein
MSKDKFIYGRDQTSTGCVWYFYFTARIVAISSFKIFQHATCFSFQTSAFGWYGKPV